jgi:hypothetical protein
MSDKRLYGIAPEPPAVAGLAPSGLYRTELSSLGPFHRGSGPLLTVLMRVEGIPRLGFRPALIARLGIS